MKKKYEKPELEELKFSVLDRIATSMPEGSAGFSEDDFDPDDIG